MKNMNGVDRWVVNRSMAFGAFGDVCTFSALKSIRTHPYGSHGPESQAHLPTSLHHRTPKLLCELPPSWPFPMSVLSKTVWLLFPFVPKFGGKSSADLREGSCSWEERRPQNRCGTLAVSSWVWFEGSPVHANSCRPHSRAGWTDYPFQCWHQCLQILETPVLLVSHCWIQYSWTGIWP